ncbi:uncharacterized protein LOC143182543 [Calliopsis andreniformis]|uniref:uncharacterized protein LOC143182543 n=1 Tax=Calliopsis andreniformis TaxID=337506 RepID=UPI003FCE171B
MPVLHHTWVTTVLLVPARPGKSVPPVGLLTKTARTFVQDGASTEFATQVLGTTLDNGRLYARILSTSSRVFYEKEPAPDSTSPYVVYPSRAPSDDWQLRVALDNTPIKVLKEIETSSSGESRNDSDQEGSERTLTRLDELSKENDVFNRREFSSETQRFKPAKVRPADNLPTYTVKHEYVTSGYDNLEEDQPKSFRPRLPKIFKSPLKTSVQKKADSKPLPTVTYHGFADFTTTVGETVIVFAPSTSPAPAGRPATTIKGDATLRPDDGIAVMEIRPTSVVASQEKTRQHSKPQDSNLQGEIRDPLLDAINKANVQPSVTEDFEAESSTTSTDPLLLVPDIETGSLKPTGLLKVLDSTTSRDGTTTHYKSLIYGTYIGTNYAQIIHTSSNVYFFPDEATAAYDTDDTTLNYGTTATEEPDDEQDTTVDMTTGTTPRIITTSEEAPPEMNELTTPFKDTTENVLTTLKDILESARRVLGTTESALPTLDNDIPNDIVPGDPQGRSIKGGSPKNALGHKNHKDYEEEKVTVATRLLPSTVYKTFTYFTTFFIPDENEQTTTSIRSREVVSSEVTYLTELVLPTATDKSILPTGLADTGILQTTPSLVSGIEEEQTTKQDEEIELIFKTLYTTYTYLTTFFQESTSSVSSREVVETNVITQTVGPNGVSAVVAGLFGKDDSILIAPTKAMNTISPTVLPEEDEVTDKFSTTLEQTTQETLTTLQEQDTTTDRNIPTEPGITTTDFEDTKQPVPDIEPSPTPAIPTEAVREQVKTYYTTYTYFTTIFVDDETEIETRTEVFSNVVTETIQPTAVIPSTQETLKPTTPKIEQANNPAVPPEILAYLNAIKGQKSQEEALLLAKKVQQQTVTKEDESTTLFESGSETTEFPTTLEEQSTNKNLFRGFEVNAQVTPNPPMEGEILGSMITDVVSSSSSGGGTVLDLMDKRNVVPEDQELSESNHHDVEPAPTLLLQTSYTTFTYFTTMYKDDETNVVSRLETITNVVTETIRPTAVVAVESSTLPVTYFTTFTYWTTFYKGGDTVTTSREETVSNVVTPGIAPTPTVELGVIMTYRPTTSPMEDSDTTDKVPKLTADNEVTPSDVVPIENSKVEQVTPITLKDTTTVPEKDILEPSTISPEPTTYYTTYTYFTTSYIGNETILNSRLETVTSVSIPDITATQQLATGRAIDGPVYKQTLATEEKSVTPSKSSELPKIGLISTIRSSQVQDGTTTHYMTDVHGTYIDGLYAQVVESSTKIETPPLPSSSIATPVLPTGVLSVNSGRVVDADEVTTIYFTTKQIGTLFDGLYAKVIESTSSTKIDEERKATVPPVQGHRTGLVRLIQGQIENNGTTIFYQSKVIGTSIDGRYAQIIESTSSFSSATPTVNIAPTATLPLTKPTEIPELSPSPAVIQSSLSEDSTTESPEQNDDSDQSEENEEEEEEGEDGQSSKKKSRLTFSTRKRTFTPVIRPFASRNRPTFNPKRKGAQGATTITRTDITPTITATLAGKSNRFASSRGRVSSPIGPYSSTLAPSGSRRFSGRRGPSNTASSYASSTLGSTRGRPQSRITPSSVFQGNRRGPTSIRGSSARAASRGSSSVHPAASTRYRPPIRPSSTLLRGQSTIRHEDQENDANEFTTTTLVTEETPFTEDTESGETVTTPLQTTTESSRRSTNPLLRFRRPINLNNSGRTATTPRPPTTTRRNANLNRATPPTTPRVTNARTNGRTTAPISTRPRQNSAGLFPPRGLFGKKTELPTEEQIEPTEEAVHEGEENLEDEAVEEIVDNDYEGSEHEDRTTVNRRSGKSIRPAVQIRPFTRARRTRRQASQLRQLTNRFRRPSQPGSAKIEEKSDVNENVSSKEDNGKSNAKPIARYNNRGRSLQPPRPTPKSANSPEKTSAESTELSSSKVRPRTKPSNGDRSPSTRIKPSPTSSNGRQFTLREKDGNSSSRSNYKRPNSSGSRSNSRTSSNSDRVRPIRLRNGSNKSSESSNSRRVSSRGSSRSSSRNGRRGSSRTRGSFEDIRESPTIYPDYDGTITVTHYVPNEVTIPVVNNGVTEHRNIITAQPSTEVLAPSQYSTVTGADGRPLVVIVSEVTGTNLQGQTEVTRFLLHETSTTRVSHTLTTLGGRRVSQSVIVPTTVYSVENIVSTIQPALPGNAPLANILLSQLLLGQLGQANPLLQPQGTPSTQYNTRTTSYVTTITKQQSTVIPLTFRGKEILTTLVDTSTNVVTATEFITDTVVVTPTASLPAANLNSLLLLLQQPQQSAKNPNPLLDPLFAAAPFTQSNTLPGEVERRHQPADSDYKQDSYEYSEEEDDVQEYHKSSKTRSSRGKSNDKKEEHSSAPKEESSVVTLYVSGRRPGEFSTVLSTVKVGDAISSSRRRRDTVDNMVEVRPSIPPSLYAEPQEITILAASEDSMDAHAPTQSLESVVGDVGRHISTSIHT